MRVSTWSRAIVVATITTTLVGGTAYAAAPATTRETTPVTGVIDTCDGFDVVGDLVMRSTVSVYGDGRTSVHLHFTGSIANSVTGRSGKYAEVQIDRTVPAGSGFSAGLLSRLTVPGRGSTSVKAGKVTFAPDGSVSFTPHAAGVDDGAAFHSAVCEALS
jgi:hypothetical protein